MNSVKMVWIAGIALMWAVLLSGCGRSDQQAAAETARNFVEAARSGDDAALAASLTAKAREQVQSHAEGHDRSDLWRDCTIGDVVIDNEYAAVAVKVTEGEQIHSFTFKMRREEGEWRIFALRLDEQGVTIDFEHPEAMLGELLKDLPAAMGSMFRGIGQGVGEMLRGIGDGVKAMGDGFRRGFGSAAAGH